MNKIPFQQYHLLAFFRFYNNQSLPIDVAMSSYFRQNRAVGSKDKKFISENAYALMRWKGLLDYFLKKSPSWEKRWELFQSKGIDKLLSEKDLPFERKCSAPKFLSNKLKDIFGEEKAVEFFHTSNQRAPLCIRANHLLTTRDDLLEKWKGTFECRPSSQSPYGIILKKHVQLFGLPEFKEGLFEVQDEGSQLVADLIDVKQGDHILDYCSGSGGKALAFAHKSAGQGQIYLYDIRAKALQEAKKRMKRAKVQNYQIISDKVISSKKLKLKMDWVFVDAPCSGTGTLRRNPDLKWKIDEKMIQELVGKQRTIFEKALSFVKPGGHIVYCTCSILPDENEAQVSHFLKHMPLTKVKEFSSFPAPNEMDGFFATVFRKD